MVRVPIRLADYGFSCKFGYLRYPVVRRRPVLSGFGIPTPFNLLFRQKAAVSLLGLRNPCMASNGILTVLSSSSPFGCDLVPDLP